MQRVEALCIRAGFVPDSQRKANHCESSVAKLGLVIAGMPDMRAPSRNTCEHKARRSRRKLSGQLHEFEFVANLNSIEQVVSSTDV